MWATPRNQSDWIGENRIFTGKYMGVQILLEIQNQNPHGNHECTIFPLESPILGGIGCLPRPIFEMPCPSKDAPRDRKRSHPPGLVASVKINQGPVERWNRLDPGCPGCSKVSAPMRQLPPVALPRHFQGAPSSEKITGSARVSRFLRLDYDESQTSHKKKKLRGFFSK